jgi:hypothetical protein
LRGSSGVLIDAEQAILGVPFRWRAPEVDEEGVKAAGEILQLASEWLSGA